MNWCNCNHDVYYNLSTSINEDSLKCWTCGNRITNEDLISLLIREVKKLYETVQVLEFERVGRESEKFNEEHKKMEEARIAAEKISKQTERFEIMDL